MVKTKGAVSDISSTLNVNENVERPEITTSVSSGRSWIDPSVKVVVWNMFNYETSTDMHA